MKNYSKHKNYIVLQLSAFLSLLFLSSCSELGVKPADNHPVQEVQPIQIDKWKSKDSNEQSRFEAYKTDTNSSEEDEAASILNVSPGIDRYVRFERGMRYIIFREMNGGMVVINTTKDSLEVEKIKRQLSKP